MKHGADGLLNLGDGGLAGVGSLGGRERRGGVGVLLEDGAYEAGGGRLTRDRRPRDDAHEGSLEPAKVARDAHRDLVQRVGLRGGGRLAAREVLEQGDARSQVGSGELDAQPPVEAVAEALREIAVRVPSNFRRLEGALVRVVARASISGQSPTPGLVREVFEQHPKAGAPLSPPLRSDPGEPSVAEVQQAVCAVLHLSVDDMLSSRRTPQIARARQLAMYLSREATGRTLKSIAHEFNRDHSTVLHAIRRVEGSLEPDSDTQRALEKSRELLAHAESPSSASTAPSDLNMTT